MAQDSEQQADEAAQKAYAAASEVAAAPEKAAPAKAPAAAKPVRAAAKKTIAAAKPRRKKSTRKPATRKYTRTGTKADPATANQTIEQLKEKIMANAKNAKPEYAKFVETAQAKARDVYAKGVAVAGEAGAFSKGNVEAVLASAKILGAGVQELGKGYVAESKGAVDTLTADLKELAAVKSPTELFQLQGKLARRNFDTAMAFGSKTSEQLVKLANEAFAPISNRISLAVDKVSKAA